MLVFIENHSSKALLHEDIHKIFSLPSLSLDDTILHLYNLLRDHTKYIKLTQKLTDEGCVTKEDLKAVLEGFEITTIKYIYHNTRAYINDVLRGLSIGDSVIFTNSPKSVPKFILKDIAHKSDVILQFLADNRFKVVKHKFYPDMVGQEYELYDVRCVVRRRDQE